MLHWCVQHTFLKMISNGQQFEKTLKVGVCTTYFQLAIKPTKKKKTTKEEITTIIQTTFYHPDLAVPDK